MTTRVIKIENKGHFDIYFGNRAVSSREVPETILDNPYVPLLRKYGRDRVVVMHRGHILANPE
jgi:hypothetical protein